MTDRHDDFVAEFMPVAVIDLLKVIDVDNDQCELMTEAQSARGFVVEAVGEQSSIRQASQLIVERILLGLVLEQNEFVFSTLAVGNIVTVEISHTIGRS